MGRWDICSPDRAPSPAGRYPGAGSGMGSMLLGQLADALYTDLGKIFDHEVGGAQARQVALAGDGDGAHAPGVGRFDAGHGILDHHALRRLGSQLLRRFQKEVGRGLTTRYALARNERVEVATQAEQFPDKFDVGRGRRGGQRLAVCRVVQGAEQFDGAGKGPRHLAHEIAEVCLLAIRQRLYTLRRHRSPEMRNDGVVAPAKGGPELLIAEWQALLSRQAPPSLEMRLRAVDDNAIQIPDHGPYQICH